MTRGSRIARNVIATLLVLAGIALLSGWWFVHRPLPRLDGQITMAGLKEGVIVDRDQWGRPWIRAKSTEDLVMAQGYVMAQDRLWQMDLLRRAAAGDLSEIVGPAGAENRRGESDPRDAAGGGARGEGVEPGNSRAAGIVRARRKPIYRAAARAAAD